MVLINGFIALSLTVSTVFSVQVCGKALADMLDLVCDGRGFHWMTREGMPTISKRTAVQYLSVTVPTTMGRNEKGGVVTECCRKACSLSHMENYCAASAGTYLPNPTSGPVTREIADELLNTRVEEPLSVIPTARPMIPAYSTARSVIVSTTPPPSERFPSPFGGSSRRRLHGSGSRYGYGTKFFFVRPVGPRPTRTPVVS